ncbi:acriflavin resistance efflux protein, partial [Klebsiella pneumoniae]
AVHRRGVRQQCVLDRRYRADCLLDCGGDFYPLAGGAPVAGQKARGGRPRRAV